MISLTLQGDRSRVLGLIGAVAGVVITVTSASSGPALCLLAGLAAWGMWFARRGLRVFLYGSVVLLGFIHLVRDKPVWHLIGRMSDLIGGTGYHRVKLIDAAVDHFGEWWLIGSKNSMNWGWGLQDTTNWYISNGLQGGLLTLVAFLATLVMSFRSVGAARRMSRKLRKRDIRAGKKLEYLAWGLGASLFSHCFAWLSVSYFGTMKLLFFLQLAFFAALASPVLVRRRSGKAPNRIKRLADPSESPGSSGLSPLLKRAMPAVQRPDGQRGPNL